MHGKTIKPTFVWAEGLTGMAIAMAVVDKLGVPREDGYESIVIWA